MSPETTETLATESQTHNDVPVDNLIPIIAEADFSSRWSKVWLEFSAISRETSKDGKLRAQCKHCKKGSIIAESSYGTTNAKKHLQKCKAYQHSLRIKGMNNNFDQKTYRELIAKAIIKHGYSFSWVEHEGVREIHEYLNDEVQTICRNTAKSDCLKLYAGLKAHLKDALQKVPGRICLTSDMWTSLQTDGYLCLTAHYVDSNWQLNSVVLNFCHVESKHTGEVLYGLVLKLIEDWGIENKIFSMTLDNASSNNRMQDYLKTTLGDWGFLLSNGDFFHIRCAAHVLNLIVKEGLKLIDDVVVKIKESVKYVKGSEARKINFRKAVDLARVQETKALWYDVPTRWNSTYMMLDRAILYREAFRKLHLVDSIYTDCPDSNEWEMAEQIRDVLEPFNDITELFSGSDYPTANLYFENVWSIAMLLRELSKSTNEKLKEMATNMQKKFDKYWANTDEDDYNTLFAFALILDPRYKLAFVQYAYEKVFDDKLKALTKASDLKFKLEGLLKEYTPDSRRDISSENRTSTSANTQHRRSQSRKRKFDYSSDFDKVSAYSSYEKTPLDIYLDDPREDRDMELDVLDYWRKRESRYNHLCFLARDILSVPLTTVASESTFSIGGRILNKWRSSSIPENIEALIATRSWLYGYKSFGTEEFTGSYVEWKAANTSSGRKS